MQQIYLPIISFIIFLFSFISLIALIAYPSPPPPPSPLPINNTNITTTLTIMNTTSQPKSSTTTMTTRLDWTATNPTVTNTTQPDVSTAILFNNSNILFLVNSTIIKERAENNNNNNKSSKEATPGCQPRKIFISWANVRSYLVHNRKASIPGTWIGEPLEVLRCRNFLDPCRDGQYCRVEMEECRETVMEISLKDGQKVANLTVYFVQDKKCQCAFIEPIIDDINAPPFIYNATVIRI